ncbi:SHM4 [Symbiodinium natans]|uniref:SHM4 protein n=1 Tax=Symbiodinium natans TaxID=878477 RepID=A0A812TS32_9DINO|nr:SHM4 [Symbiodinium natans]
MCGPYHIGTFLVFLQVVAELRHLSCAFGAAALVARVLGCSFRWLGGLHKAVVPRRKSNQRLAVRCLALKSSRAGQSAFASAKTFVANAPALFAYAERAAVLGRAPLLAVRQSQAKRQLSKLELHVCVCSRETYRAM